jgi:(p)ppGpp synthase/HD superfamily hydrolase
MLIHKAIEFAATMHHGQVRKGTTLPYLVHLFETAVILAQNGASEEVICAGILHDTIEDTATTKQNLIEEFGQKVANLVFCNTENKTLGWEKRKQETIDYIKNQATQEECMVICADKLANARSLYADQQKVGNHLWKRFKRSYIEQKWYYKSLATALDNSGRNKVTQELKTLVDKIFIK